MKGARLLSLKAFKFECKRSILIISILLVPFQKRSNPIPSLNRWMGPMHFDPPTIRVINTVLIISIDKERSCVTSSVIVSDNYRTLSCFPYIMNNTVDQLVAHKRRSCEKITPIHFRWTSDVGIIHTVYWRGINWFSCYRTRAIARSVLQGTHESKALSARLGGSAVPLIQLFNLRIVSKSFQIL